MAEKTEPKDAVVEEKKGPWEQAVEGLPKKELEPRGKAYKSEVEKVIAISEAETTKGHQDCGHQRAVESEDQSLGKADP